MFKIGRALMILLILFAVMGLIGWGVYLAVQGGLGGTSLNEPGRNSGLEGYAHDGGGSGTGTKSGAGRSNSSALFASESLLPNRELDQFSISRGLAGLVKDIFVIGMISLVVGGSDAFIGWWKRRSSRLVNKERISA